MKTKSPLLAAKCNELRRCSSAASGFTPVSSSRFSNSVLQIDEANRNLRSFGKLLEYGASSPPLLAALSTLYFFTVLASKQKEFYLSINQSVHNFLENVSSIQFQVDSLRSNLFSLTTYVAFGILYDVPAVAVGSVFNSACIKAT